LSPFSPAYNPLGRLGLLGQWFTVSDQSIGYGLQNTSLLLLHTGIVPIDFSQTQFSPLFNLWRPNLVEAIRSYIHIACLHAAKHNMIANLAVRTWISEIVHHTICGVEHTPKCEIENEV